MVKTYNVGAFGLPPALELKIASAQLPLKYSAHSLREAINDRYGVLPASAFPQTFQGAVWSLVEAETFNGILSKFVVRRVVDARRSLVLVIMVDGTVKTLWTNLNTDKHSTLDKSKFSQP